MSVKKEISIGYLKQIAKEELCSYVDDRLNEKNLRKTINEELEKSGKDIIFNSLGLKYNTWDKKWELNSYGNFEKIIKEKKSMIEDIGAKAITEIIKDITPEDILATLTQPNKAHLKKVYKETLMKYFEERVRQLAIEHGTKHANELFKEYLSENEFVENNSNNIVEFPFK